MTRIFLIQFLATSGLMMALSIPMIRRMVPRNGLYGFRVPKTLASDAVWYPANEYSGRQLLGAGAMMALGAVILYLIPGVGKDVTLYPSLNLVVMIAALGVAVVRSFVYLKTL